MLRKKPFLYEPDETEKENASNSYLMSLIALMVGLPLPVINLIATGIFYVAHRKGRLFTRWHCTQAMLSQFMLFFINLGTIGWIFLIISNYTDLSNYFIAYVLVALVINLAEFIMTIYSATVIRKGTHVEWWFLGDLTNQLVLKDDHPADSHTPLS
ncbi:hypothetical protein QLX67_11445 [Balneolaceae bacterium ANBcel3]|nr:hypothetical protein [Balneolaceae bacterium ANBcel3]